MRVGYDVSKVFGPPDGVARYAASLLRALVEVSEQRGGTLSFQLHAPNAAPDARDWKRLLADLPPCARRGPGRFPRLGEVDLFHTPSFSDAAGFDGPLVYNIHDLTFLTHPQFHVPENRNHCLIGTLRAVERNAAILALSQATAAEVRRWFALPEERLHVVCPAASEAFAALGPRDLAAAQDRLAGRFGLEGPFALSVGSLEPRKNVARLVDAYAGLAPEWRRRVPLVLVGGGGWKRDAVYRGDWPDFARPLGAVSEEDLLALYNAATVVAYPSLVEGFGLPVVEAMACGTPVLTSNVSSLAEVGAGAALCVNPLSVQAIRDGLESLLGDPSLRRRYREAGLARAAEYSWRKAAEQVIDVYGQVVGRNAAAARETCSHSEQAAQ